MNYPEIKLALEVVKLIAVTGMLVIVLKRHRTFTGLLPSRILSRTFGFLVVFWLGFLADVFNDVYPTSFTKVLDDIILSITLIFGAYLTWWGSRTTLRKSIAPKRLHGNHTSAKIKSGAHIVSEQDVNEIIRLSSGKKILFVTRRPEIMKNLEIPYIWVTKVPGEHSIDPSDMHILLHKIAKSMDEETVIVLDAVEYLILENGFGPTMKFLTALKDITLEKKATLLILLNTESLEKRERAFIEMEFPPLTSSSEDFAPPKGRTINTPF
ncbi:DUF835 domain-containing protein [Thermococcus indicus]|uniref:DUF835 domain-containing protein n=1 Tax=Thermococcus indicus TaxID=2586643 RepID=A0A4Y5SMG0_9EURY|nr:DUF835 domain-containing protein [Thermococcus indicus]QDA32078.1 DUF835 domain-containing protein [Thermococcus indicus]